MKDFKRRDFLKATAGVAAGTAAADSKQPAKVQVHDISIVHYVDKASPVLR